MDFYNASLTVEEDPNEVFKQLAESLRILTNASTGVSETARLIAASNSQIDPNVIQSSLINNNNNSLIPNQNNDHHATTTTSTPLTNEKPAKKKVEKDPNAPKKPLTVFFAYSAYVRQALREERLAKGLPALSSTEITQEISKKWNELGEAEKEKWKEAYNEELEHYHVNKEKYLELKKIGEAPILTGPNPAPVPIPAYLQKNHHDKSSKKRDSESSEKKDKKKKSKKRKSNAPDSTSTDIQIGV